MSKNKKTAEITALTTTKPKLARPLKPMSSYTSTDELKLIIGRAHKVGDTEYAALAQERLQELQSISDALAPKKAVRPAKAKRTA